MARFVRFEVGETTRTDGGRARYVNVDAIREVAAESDSVTLIIFQDSYNMAVRLPIDETLARLLREPSTTTLRHGWTSGASC